MSYEDEMEGVIVVDDSQFLNALKEMRERGEIEENQYLESLRRSNER